MVETISAGSKTETFVLSNLADIPDSQVPFLCEIWNWQGDTSVLPHKVFEIV